MAVTLLLGLSDTSNQTRRALETQRAGVLYRDSRIAPAQEEALERVQELRRGAGTQFDAPVVDALCCKLATAEPAVAAI